jgi:hypothetical protein
MSKTIHHGEHEVLNLAVKPDVVKAHQGPFFVSFVLFAVKEHGARTLMPLPRVVDKTTERQEKCLTLAILAA